MKLSVVIPTRDKRQLLARTLSALEAQEGVPEPWEIVVVDDASSDGTPELLARLSELSGSRTRVITCAQNVGRATARNRGAQAARGTWLLFMDDDIVAPPGLLAAHARLLARGPQWGTIGRVATDPSLVDGPHFQYIDSRGVAKVRDERVPARYFVTQNAGVPRDALLAAGGFDERFRAYGMEDMEVAFRLEEKAGLRFLPLMDPVPLHVHRHTLTQYLAKKRECGRESLPLLAELHPGRLREMQLQWIVDPTGASRPSLRVRIVRRCLCSAAMRGLFAVVSAWPASRAHRARWSSLYNRCMDLLVLSAYCQGLSEIEREGQ